MSAAMLSQDLVSVCLLACEGDIESSAADIILSLERYQEKYDRHFGISRQDLRGLFIKNFSDTRSKDLSECLPMKFRDIIPPLLQYFDAYFNDESEYFTTCSDESLETEKYLTPCMYGYDDEEYKKKLILKNNMKEFFTENNNPGKEEVLAFLQEHDIDHGLLMHCSRSGRSS